MFAKNPLVELREDSKVKSSLCEWQKQALRLQKEFYEEHSSVQARIKELMAELDRIAQQNFY